MDREGRWQTNSIMKMNSPKLFPVLFARTNNARVALLFSLLVIAHGGAVGCETRVTAPKIPARNGMTRLFNNKIPTASGMNRSYQANR